MSWPHVQFALLFTQLVSATLRQGDFRKLPEQRFPVVTRTLTVRSAVGCCLACQRAGSCQVVAHHRQSGTCELANFRPGDDGLIQFAAGWTIYYDAADACSSSPCQNLGVCHDVIGHYTCTCTPDWTGDSCETALCPSGWDLVGTSCYYIDTIPRTWANAKSACSSYTSGGHLLDITTAAENTAVINLFNTNHPGQAEQIWVGGQDVNSNEVYYWTDGSPVSGGFEFWYTDQPDNWGGAEDCMLIRSYQDFRWNDGDCASSLWFICEVELP